MKISRSLPLWALFAALPACAPSLSTFQPAHVGPKGHWQASAGAEMSVAPGAIADTVSTARGLAKNAESNQPLTSDEKVQVFDGGVRLLLNPPLSVPTTHALVSYVPVERLEVSARYAGGAWRLGGRYQVASREKGPCDFTVGLGVSRFTYKFPLSDTIPLLKLDDFSRWQVDMPILVGTSRDWMRVWAGPKLLLTSFSTKLSFDYKIDEIDLASFDGKAMYVGAQAGAAIGYRWVFFAFELTMMEMVGSASSQVTIPNNSPISHDTSMRGFIIFPSFGVMAEF
jgi:hypothetical protein